MPPRIVSLHPAATEMLALIGAEPLLVGRSHECDHPHSVLPLPALTRPAVPLDPADPAEIDRRARASAAAREPFTHLDLPRLADLRPDVIFTQDLCGICALHDQTLREAIHSIPSHPRIVTLTARTVEGVLDDLITVGRAADRESAAMDAAVALRERFFRAAEFTNPYADGPVVGFLEWTEPLFIAGHWTVQLIERAGARHPLNPTIPRPGSGAAAGPQHAEAVAGRSIAVPAEVFAASNPEYLIICPCGFTLEQTRAAARRLAREPWFAGLPAARAGRVALVDGNQMFNRPGPRLADAFEWLTGWLHGRADLIPPGFPWQLA
ncbi:MAG: ABC transporter substrate-binding protein [Phycisphaerales bacterium]|nr:ABC transporter substrate-binding protein [Phycisphaerales bacterium]